MKKFLLYSFFSFFFIPREASAQFETSRDSVVQLYGVIMTADSLVGIPAVSVVVKGQNRDEKSYMNIIEKLEQKGDAGKFLAGKMKENASRLFNGSK